MDTVLLFDPSISSRNLGDDIISECAHAELEKSLRGAFVREMPTHLPVVHAYQIWRNSAAVQILRNANRKFVLGSNLLVKNMLTHYPQWNVNAFNYQIQQGCILVGVGAGAEEKSNTYTTKLYQKMLNRDFYHSVRDERSKLYLESMGIKAINTGCVTMWKLTPEFCADIPTKKANRVVFTLTGKTNGVDQRDQALIDILVRNYQEVFYWVQGDLDLDYLSRFTGTEKIQVLPAMKQAYDRLLNEDDLDYVGTRLHGGVYAMRHKKRAIIIAIDERAREINACNRLNCIEREAVETKLEEMIQSEFATEIEMPLEEIQRWKEQFTR